MHEDILRNEIDKMKKEYDFSKRIAQRGSINLKSEVARLRIFCWTALAKRLVHAGEGAWREESAGSEICPCGGGERGEGSLLAGRPVHAGEGERGESRRET